MKPWFPQRRVEWECSIFGLVFKFSWRSIHESMGRFGGGWNWKIGAQWSRTDFLLSLLVAEVVIKQKQEEES